MQRGPYEVIEQLSDHPRHVLLRATLRDNPDERRILKTLKQDPAPSQEVARLKSEYAILDRLAQMPGIVRTEACARLDGLWSLVLQDHGGASLAQLITSEDLDLPTRLNIAVQLCRAVASMHTQGVLHKQITPERVLWNADANAVALTDFSRASLMTSERADVVVPDDTTELRYIAPEQTGRINRTVDHRADLYSLGATLYMCFTGSEPFPASDPLALVHAHIARKPEAPHERNPELPVAISQIVLRLLEKNAEARYRSAFGAGHDLARCLDVLRRGEPLVPFELGAEDRAIAFQVSDRLVGRDEEAAQLVARYHDAAAKRTQVTLVSGYSGAGKTALIREIHRPMAERPGTYISGKFDPFTRNVPYSAIVQAFDRLMESLLSRDQAELFAYKERILAATGPNTRVITDVIRNVELVVGPQPAVPVLGALENANRFRITLQRFVEVFITPERPLVFFIDDLQWADPASLGLLVQLAKQPERSLYLIGAYRSNEVDEKHSLQRLISAIERSKTTLLELHLEPLDVEDLGELLQDTLDCPADEVAELASIAKTKTDGNPYAFRTFLEHHHTAKHITFDAALNRWTWDEAAMGQDEASANVVTLLVDRMASLTPELRVVLGTAGCLGNEFHAPLLAEILERPVGKVLRDLHELARQRYLSFADPSASLLLFQEERDILEAEDALLLLRFAHDRVQQASIELLDEDARLDMHRRAGAALWARHQADPSRTSVFSVVDQLNAATATLDDAAKLTLGDLNRQAGEAAMQSVAYESAYSYLSTAAALIDAKEAWETQYETQFRMYLNLAQALHLTGRIEAAGKAVDELLTSARSIPDRCQVYAMVVAQKVQQFDIAGALSLGLEGLEQLGVPLPANPTIQDLDDAALDVDRAMEGRLIENNLHLPKVEDPALVRTHELINSMYDAAYIGNPPLLQLLVRVGTRLSIEHGNHETSGTHYAYYGMLRSSSGFPDGVQWGALANALNEAENATALRCKILCVQGTVVNHPFRPMRSTLPLMEESFSYGSVYGDNNYATYANLHRLNGMWIAGLPIREVRIETQPAFEFASQIGMLEDTFRAQLQFHDALTGASDRLDRLDGDWLDEDTFVEQYQDNPYVAYDVHFKRAMLRWFAGQWSEAYEIARDCAANTATALFGSNISLYARFLHGLAAASSLPHATAADRPALLAALRDETEEVARYAAWCEENYLALHQLLQAELAAHYARDATDALPDFEEAIETARRFDQPHHAAIAAERALTCARSASASIERQQRYLNLAASEYEAWGATAKAKALRAEHAEITGPRPPVSSAGLSARLDLDTLIRATQSLTHEVHLDRLLATLLQVMMANAGAEAGYLFLAEEDGSLVSQARGDADGVHDVLANVPLAEHPRIPQSVVRYCQRTQRAVVLGDATAQGDFTSDPAVAAYKLRSVVALPIVNQGALRGVLYLENAGTADVFTAERVEFLEVVAAQGAISMENAKLYATLEARVEERTEQLAARNRDMRAILANLHQGIFVILEDGTIHPEYSPFLETILGEADLAGRPALELMLGHTGLGTDAVARIDSALCLILGDDPIQFDLNQSQLPRELVRGTGQQQKQLEADWEPILDADGFVDRVMVSLRDVTQLNALRAARDEQQQRLAILGEILSISAESFDRFVRSALSRLQACDEAMAVPPTTDVVNELFRHIHTIKGSARAYQFQHMVDAIHEAEQVFQQARDGGMRDVERWRVELGHVRSAVERYRDLYVDMVQSRVKRSATPLTGGPRGLAAGLDDALAAIPTLAARLGKVVPHVDYIEENIDDWPYEDWLGEVFHHLVSNALDHGLEDAETRKASGKPAAGTLKVRAHSEGDLVRIEVEDDGRGLDLATLRARCTAAGWSTDTDEEVAASIFRPGLSTAETVTEVSGRGAGLDAVAAEVSRHGGLASIAFRGTEVGGRRPFAIVLELPRPGRAQVRPEPKVTHE